METALTPHTPLEKTLETLSQYGKVRLVTLGSDYRWRCTVDMFVAGDGVSFEISSEFGHKTAHSAASECLDYLNTTLRKLGVKL